MRIIFFALLAVSYSAAQIHLEPDTLASETAKITAAMAVATGYELEVHHVTTSDGYILSLCRIYKGSAEGKKVVFLMPGIYSSSVDWVILKEESLPYMLAGGDYDVWIGNPRGNTFSKVYNDDLNTTYWNFSWEEIGLIDLPAQIDFILSNTNQESLDYIGHGQAVTSFLAMASEQPDHSTKVKRVQALSPLVFMSNMKSPIKYLAPVFAHLYHPYEFAGHDSLEITLVRAFCQASGLTGEICLQVLFLFVGSDPDQINSAWLGEIFENWPAGGSSLQLVHLAQNLVDNKFQHRRKILGQQVTQFDLSKVKVPVFLFYGENDLFVQENDIIVLCSALGDNCVGNTTKIEGNFNHLDFSWGKKTNEVLYPQIIFNLQNP